MEWQSECFIIDGHHKLLAYKNVNIAPPIFYITQGFSKPEEIKFDLPFVKNAHVSLAN